MPEQPTTPTEKPTEPAPAAPAAPAQAPEATPAAAPQPQVQYVISQQSLEGIGGWLAFWIVAFVIFAVGYITFFFATIESAGDSAASVVTLIFAPLLAIGFIASATTIAMRKKIGIIASVGTLGVLALYNTLNTIIASIESELGIAVTVGSILGGLVLTGAMALYFIASKRVKQTLTR